MKCRERKLVVVNSTEFCTKEVQVVTEKGIMFVSIGSRIFQETYQKVECEAKEFGDIFQVEN